MFPYLNRTLYNIHNDNILWIRTNYDGNAKVPGTGIILERIEISANNAVTIYWDNGAFYMYSLAIKWIAEGVMTDEETIVD